MAGFNRRASSGFPRGAACRVSKSSRLLRVKNWMIPCLIVLGSFSTLLADEPESRATLKLDGLVAPARRIAMPALVTGPATQIPLRLGDRIEAGALVLKIDDSEARLAVNEAEGATLMAQAQLQTAETNVLRATLARDLAMSDLNRARQSRERVSDSVTDAELERRGMLLDQTQADLRIAQSQVEVAKGELHVASTRLETAQQRLIRHELKAPFTGQVSRLVAREGEWIEAGQTAIELIDTQTLRIVTFLPAELRDAWQSEMRIEIQKPGTSEVLYGTPYSLAAEVEPATGKLLAMISIDSAVSLLPGERVHLRIFESSTTEASNP